jgi:hypothetical protein
MEIFKSLNKDPNLETSDAVKYPSKAPRKEYVQVKDRRKEQGMDEKNPIVVDNLENESNKERENAHQAGTRRANNTEPVTHQNSFDVLKDSYEIPSPRAVMVQQDRLLEEDINNDITDQLDNRTFHDVDDAENTNSSSPDSDFVDATQTQADFHPSIDTELNNAEIAHSTPERVQKDMEFLNQSWANIIENDEAE